MSSSAHSDDMQSSTHSEDIPYGADSEAMPSGSHNDQPRSLCNNVFCQKTIFLKSSKSYRLVAILWGHAIERSQWSI